MGCDLLLNLYLWHLKHTLPCPLLYYPHVVICFWICTFDISNTPTIFVIGVTTLLWFAFEFVPLTYQTHPYVALWSLRPVVICFWICTFDISNTPVKLYLPSWPRCDLLLNLYLWHIKHTLLENVAALVSLWFAFEFVPLTYQTHHDSHTHYTYSVLQGYREIKNHGVWLKELLRKIAIPFSMRKLQSRMSWGWSLL